MMNYKDNLKNLIDFRDMQDFKLYGSMKEKIDEYEQETAVEQLHFSSNTERFVISINDKPYILKYEDFNVTSNYSAMEEEWVELDNKIKDISTVTIYPLYFETDRLLRKSDLELVEHYEKNNLIPEDNNIPDSLMALVNHLKEINNLTLNEDYDFDIEPDDKQIYSFHYEGDSISFQSDFVPSIELIEELNNEKIKEFRKDGVYSVLASQYEEYKPSKLIEDLKLKSNVDFNEMKEINKLVNISYKPHYFLKNLNKLDANSLSLEIKALSDDNSLIKCFSFKDVKNKHNNKI